MFIILHNPLSRNKKSKRVTKKVIDKFKAHNIPFRLKSLLKIKDIEQYIKKTPKDINILLLGGDGTINTFMNNTYNLAIENEIYLKGNGSGNDFLRSLKRQAPKYQRIMVMQYNEKKRYFMNGAGLGMDGYIAHLVNQSKRKNRFNYFLNTLKAFFIFKPKYAEITIDGMVHKFKKAYLINVNSGEFIGGGIRLTPKAKLEEDMLDIVVVHRIPKPLLFIIFLSVYFGKHTLFKRYVFYTKGKHVKATMFSPQVAQCDGESFDKTYQVDIKTTKKSAKFKLFDFEKNT